MTREQAKRFPDHFWICALLMAVSVAPAQTPQPTGETVDKISARVRERAQAGGMLPVFIVLNRQPHQEILARVHGVSETRLRSAESDYYGLAGQPMAPNMQVDLAQAHLHSVIADIRQEAFRQIEADIRPEQDYIESLLRSLGAVGVERYSVLNMVRASIPASGLVALDAEPMIASIVLIGKKVPHLSQ
jgi:hypothetical protein